MVTSGAVGAGLGRLGIARRPHDLAELQAVAALGQSHLIEVYNRELESHGHRAAQVLLTADDLHDRRRYLNVRNTLLALFEFGAIPIVNENDTVRVDELQRNVGDNDRLAAMVTNLLRAPLLILLSDVAGLFDGDPDDPQAALISVVDNLDSEVENLACDDADQNKLSKGGMRSKLQAARMATAAGENVIIADGRQANVLAGILSGQPIGTLFPAEGPAVGARKRWIGLTVHPQGKLTLDAGACRAIVEQGSSLLAVGVTAVAGDFQKGDILSLVDSSGHEMARGLSNYSAEEMRLIAGHSTAQFTQLLGHRPYDEVIHRDNLALVR